MTDQLTDEAVKALRAEQTSSPNPYDDCAHFDDHAVNRFAVAMKGKLAAKRLQGRGGWQEPDVENGYLSRLLREHVDKGDPVDVANLAMMIHQRGERIGPENEGATCGAIERAEAERDRLAADLAQARADAQAAVALVVEQAAAECEVLVEYQAVVLDEPVTNSRYRSPRETKAAIRALAPADGLAAVQALRATADGYKHAAEGFAAELAASRAREAGDTDLLLACYKALLVLRRICDKSGLISGADAANNIADRIVAAHPEIPGRASLRAALAEVQARDDASTPPDTWHERRTMLPDGDARKEGGK